MREMSERFPANYIKVYNPMVGEEFHSKHIQNQSIISNAEEGIRISVVSKQPSERFADVKTLYDIFKCGLEHSKFLPCLGSRGSVKEPYDWLVYQEVNERLRCFGSALIETVGFSEEEENFVGIYSRNTPEWVITQYACAAYSYVYVPLYDTLGADAMRHILNQTNLKVLFCDSSNEVSSLLRDLRASCITCIVVKQEDQLVEDLRTEFADQVKIFRFEEFLELGRRNPHPVQPPEPDDLCTLCYTSGSTGIPKGVMLLHGQLVDATKAIVNAADGKFAQQFTVHLSYLPLAHILEQLLMTSMIMSGARAGFLTTGRESIIEDLQTVQPTILGVVPRVLSKFRAEFYKKIPKYAWVRNLIEKRIDEKNKEITNGNYRISGAVDHLIFKRMRQLFGGRICAFICGGAPLVPEVSRFYRAVFSCPVIEGYGATETTGLLTVTPIGDPNYGLAGAPATGVEIRLIDVPEMGISVSRDGVGEICARGFRMTKGYYKDPENTQKLFTNDGWLRLGDIGHWTQSGALKIVDRCKNMFKLSQGEYIAAEKVEGFYQCCPFVQFALVEGDSSRPFAVAVVHPDLPILRGELTNSKSNSKYSKLPDEQLCGELNVRKFILKKMNAVGRERGLKGLELAKSIYLAPEPFTIENGLLTPTFKIARYRARMFFKEKIQKLYDDGELDLD